MELKCRSSFFPTQTEGARSVFFSVTNAHSSRKSASNNTFTFLLPVSESTQVSWNTCTYPHLSHPSSTHKISANNCRHSMPSAIHNSPRRCSYLSRPVMILTPFQRQWLLESKAFLATMTKAAWKAGQRRPNNHHAGSSTAQNKALLISSPTYSYKSYKSQRLRWTHHLERHLREKQNLLACTLRCKTKRSDSEAFTIGSNKRLQKPD